MTTRSNDDVDDDDKDDDDDDADSGVSINASGRIWRVSCHLH